MDYQNADGGYTGARGTLLISSAVRDAVQHAIDMIDSGRADVWIVAPANNADLRLVRAALRAAGRQGELCTRVRQSEDFGSVIVVAKKYAGRIPDIVRAFYASGEVEQWYHFPATGQYRDRAHRAHAVKTAIWREGLAGLVGYGVTREGYLHLYRKNAPMDAE